MTAAAIWQWLGANAGAIGAVVAACVVGFGVIGAVWVLIGRLLPKSSGDDIPAAALADRVVDVARGEGRLGDEMETARGRLADLRDRLEAAIKALAGQRANPDAPAGIDEALALLAEGRTEAAEGILKEVLDRREAEGARGVKEAAATARHIGALAYLRDTEMSRAAYRKAVDLDPDDGDGGNRFGH